MCTIGLETKGMLASTFGGRLNWQLSGGKFQAMRFSLIVAVFLGPLLCLGVAEAQSAPARILYWLACEAFTVSITLSCTVFRSPSSTLTLMPLLSYALSCSASYQSKSSPQFQLKTL
jgi:hypothetical protein